MSCPLPEHPLPLLLGNSRWQCVLIPLSILCTSLLILILLWLQVLLRCHFRPTSLPASLAVEEVLLHVSLSKPWPHTKPHAQDQCPASSKYLITCVEGMCEPDKDCGIVSKEHLGFSYRKPLWEREWLGYVTKLWEVRWCGWPQEQPEPVFPLSVSLGVRCIPPIRDQLFPHGRDLAPPAPYSFLTAPPAKREALGPFH